MDLFGEPDPVPAPKEPPVDLTQEAVEAEAFQHPRNMEFCLGHEALLEALKEKAEAGRLPHGLIFSGPKGIGKATAAYQLTKHLLQNEALVTSGAHPDLMSVERAYDAAKNTYKASVDVAEIRKVTPFLRMTASYGGWRVVIIDDADTMNRNAQNALLKILEEPPENTVLILVTHRLGALIPTIRSRTQLIQFQPLEQGVITDLLNRSGQMVAGPDLEILMQFCDGSFGKILQMIEDDGLEVFRQVLDLLQAYPSWDWPAIHAAADVFGRAGPGKGYQLFVSVMNAIFAELTATKARGLTLPGIFQPLEPLYSALSLAQLLEICDKLSEHFSKVEHANLDKRQGVLLAFSIITPSSS